jgi:hypothetical protein
VSVINKIFIDVNNELSKNTIKPRRHTMILSDLGRAAQTQTGLASMDRWERDRVFHTKKYIYRYMSN